LRIGFTGVRGPVLECCCCHTFRVQDIIRAPDQEQLFYATIDEQRYVDYFAPFRKGQYTQVLRGINASPGSTLLDVGASYGWMVEVGLDLGFDSYGLEPGAAAWPHYIHNRMFRRSLEQFAQEADCQFDVVTIWHVLEHLPDPVGTVEYLRRLLKPGGTLVVAVPTRDGWMFKLALILESIFGNQRLLNELFYFHNANMHYFYYGFEGVKRLLERARFSVQNHFTMEAFDWNRIHSRVTSKPLGGLVRLLGPLLNASGFTRRENLIVVAQRSDT
jgi:SAM-dependent methyltransferase